MTILQILRHAKRRGPIAHMPHRTAHETTYLDTDTHTHRRQVRQHRIPSRGQSAVGLVDRTIGLPFRLRPHTVEMEPAAPEAAPRPLDPRQSRQ